MKVYGKTDVGKVRESNQDNMVFKQLDEGCLYAVVCDGMGGHNGGNVASELAVRTFDASLSTSYDDFARSRSVEELLKKVIRHANDAVFAVSLKDEGLRGMGTTVVMTYVIDGSAYIAHVGDSRAYLYDGCELSRLTRDHSIVQKMLDDGEINEEEAKVHPYRHVITRVLGFTSEVEADIDKTEFSPTDIILLCSDGLTNMLEDSEIESVFEKFPAEEVCDELVARALKNGGTDNVTAVLVCGDEIE